jgi:hypothetical protein
MAAIPPLAWTGVIKIGAASGHGEHLAEPRSAVPGAAEPVLVVDVPGSPVALLNLGRYLTPTQDPNSRLRRAKSH